MNWQPTCVHGFSRNGVTLIELKHACALVG